MNPLPSRPAKSVIIKPTAEHRWLFIAEYDCGRFDGILTPAPGVTPSELAIWATQHFQCDVTWWLGTHSVPKRITYTYTKEHTYTEDQP